MTKFSANLGFLWADLPLPDAIRTASRAGFEAVECHWPYDTNPLQVKAALSDTGMKMLGLNTLRGQPGENGLSALPGRENEARSAIDRAIAYSLEIGCKAIHVMAGFAEGPEARRCFASNLSYACRVARPHHITILIEPLNRYDAPGYFLQTSDQAESLIEAVGQDNLRLMFDCYHLQIMEGDITRRLRNLRDIIGHVQIASIPDRGPPDSGELDYRHVFAILEEGGWDRPVGAEYKSGAPTEQTLGWLSKFGGTA